MKKITVFCFILVSLFGCSQVGINTPNPLASLDVTSKNPTGNSSNIDELLIHYVEGN
ncbi:hypothetical protein SAMN05421841_0664 [Chryseobacterium wanjuense]|jgi:hypothetical protein|uniref:Uncharacterized protein n=1 Tax=Chryseobacterium wanjuense TaxID=356305 RepID=A0A1I0NLI9_9FLAO|nr:hypothetical protein SAMN05421841_0664 [Chryseobacterium wanjuense]